MTEESNSLQRRPFAAQHAHHGWGLTMMTIDYDQPTDAAVDDDVARLQKFKQMLDAGLISQADYDVAKMKVLGL